MSVRAWSQEDVAQRLRFGSGAVADLPAMLRELGLRRVVLITSAGRAASEDGARLVRLTREGAGVHLRRRGTPSARGRPSAPPTPPSRVRAPTGSSPSGVGAVVDCGKAVAFFIEQQAGVPGRSVLDRPALVHVAVPTTYSPGVLSGEFTMTDPHTRTKGRGRHPHVRAERRRVRP